ncbi:carbohydrate ABC transporter permease [Ketogulonicigenium vulgare]|uniref:Sugar ABC transporter, permease protein n=1 Tax=Ketogulonicigenium vulgare (strain WSH-001) TaxID=759362 RepID=F9Y8Q7_KETVW|nr:sugar ABC transporter permease [Ketogulonicigenium vulgare]AEM41226.1 sugar ABC transporter, permease protein [Ketogulonicigenium vulgare WSH-001]ALJ81368.1 sugar ABC transporter permease [Ketogulonicigenium vulgare]ANW34099.1 sugar ABC transporter permease [Ketogulonicigenium vulgare]AOZ54959.1 sugar ABC transporter, permease protein [Ketogulonicigenium vulgare]
MSPARKRNAISPAAISNGILWLIVLSIFMGAALWSVWISLTNSKILPSNTFVGLRQYVELFQNERWLSALNNIAVFGVLFVGISLLIGLVMAILIDQKVRGENLLRTIYMLPHAMSFIVAGLAWQWLMNPGLGLQTYVQAMGWESFRFDWTVRPETAIYAVVLAGVWQGSGLMMVIILAALRGVDQDIWKASRIDGIPAWRVYLRVVLPMLTPAIGTSAFLLSLSVVKAYDLVVATTNGGPGHASDVPARFAMDYYFSRYNIGLASAASVSMLVAVLAALAPWMYLQHVRARKGGH